MTTTDSVIATFDDHAAADRAIKQLAASGFPMTSLSVVGKGYHTEEKVVGFYSTLDRVKFWGERGAMWGGLWGMFFGGLFLTVPIVGPVVVLGFLASVALSVLESAVVVGGLSAFGAAILTLGIPKDSVIAYEATVEMDGFLVMAHGTPAEMARAHDILSSASPVRFDRHTNTDATVAIAAE